MTTPPHTTVAAPRQRALSAFLLAVLVALVAVPAGAHAQTTTTTPAPTTTTPAPTTPTTPTAPPKTPAKGLMDETLARSGNKANRDRFWKAVEASKSTFVRTYIDWDGTLDQPLANEIGPIRRLATEAVQHGVTTMHVDFTGTLGSKYDDARDIDLTKYQTMVGVTAAYLQDLPIKLVYSPWNESNYGVLLPQKNGPEVWRKMQNLAYDAIKLIDPDAQVAIGELAPYARNKRLATDPGTFMRKALGLSASWRPLAGTKNETFAVKGDLMTLHPYDYTRDPNDPRKSKTQWTVTNLNTPITLWKRAAAAGRLPTAAPKTVVATEFAYLAGTSQKISEAKASTYLARAWRKAKRAKLAGFLWFQVKDPPTGTFKSGLTTNTNRQRKVYKTWSRLK